MRWGSNRKRFGSVLIAVVVLGCTSCGGDQAADDVREVFDREPVKAEQICTILREETSSADEVVERMDAIPEGQRDAVVDSLTLDDGPDESLDGSGDWTWEQFLAWTRAMWDECEARAE